MVRTWRVLSHSVLLKISLPVAITIKNAIADYYYNIPIQVVYPLLVYSACMFNTPDVCRLPVPFTVDLLPGSVRLSAAAADAGTHRSSFRGQR